MSHSLEGRARCKPRSKEYRSGAVWCAVLNYQADLLGGPVWLTVRNSLQAVGIGAVRWVAIAEPWP